MQHSSSARRPRRVRATLAVTALATAVASSVAGTGIAAASYKTKEQFLTYSAPAIAAIDAAYSEIETAQSPDQWSQAYKHISIGYYNRYYENYENRSMGLNSNPDGTPRKPFMEGLKSTVLLGITNCEAEPDTCDRTALLAATNSLRVNFARDVLVLSGLVNRNDPVAVKMKAGEEYLKLLHGAGNTLTSHPSYAELEKLAQEAASKEGAHKGKVPDNSEISSNVAKDPSQLSSYLYFLGEDATDGGPDSGSSSQPLLIIAGVVAVLTVVGVAAAGSGMVPGLTLPALPGLPTA